MSRKAFTLIELLIVVAIIAILAAIAVPNFLEAQTRAKVSRAKSDLRTQATALESYAVDNNAYPNCHRFGIAGADFQNVGPFGGDVTQQPERVLERLSTPIAYISNALTRDVFKVGRRVGGTTALATKTATITIINPTTDAAALYNSYIYQSWNAEQRTNRPYDSFNSTALSDTPRAWLLHSAGPDAMYYNLGGIIANDGADQLEHTIDMIYDPTNGTISRGSIWRVGGAPVRGATYAGAEGLRKAIELQK